MTTTPQNLLEHRDAMLDVFTEITQDCLLLGLAPGSVHVDQWRTGRLSVAVHFHGKDEAAVTAVDALAASYDFPPAAADHPNYTRVGGMDIDGRRVEVTVYCGRPETPAPVAPAFPAGYSPAVVEA